MNRQLAGSFDAQGGLVLSEPAPGSGPLLCLLDGWLDNSAALARELGLGAPSSPEAILACGYRHWGEGLPARMRGDFALVIWDRERGEGLIARDQLGVRPLYLHRCGRTLRFAGEISHLLAMLPQRPGPDPAGVAHWIAMSRRPGTQTLYSGVQRLGPGEMLLLDRRGARPRRYWAPRFEEPLALAPEALAGEVRTALERAVRVRLSLRAPTGVLMSGGLDSSAVAAVGAGLGRGEVRAYSATFPDHPATDESALVAELRETLGLGGAIGEVRAGGLLASAVKHLAAWQMPLAAWGDFWVLELMRAAAAEGVAIMLDGDGGDELFGPRQYLLADRIRAGHPLQALKIAGELPGAGPHVGRREVGRVLLSWGLVGALPYGVHRLGTGVLTRRQAPRWLRRQTRRDLIASDDPAAWKRLDGPRWWGDAAYGIAYGMDEAGVYEHQRRRAALAGLDARHPLLDFDLVGVGLRQPPRATLDRRFNRPVLRSAVAGLLPDSVRLRPQKARFDSLIVSCLAGADAESIRRILLDPGAELRAYLDQGEMERELFGQQGLRESDPFGWMWRVWRLVTAELWLRSQASTPWQPPPLSPSIVSIDTSISPTFSHLAKRP